MATEYSEQEKHGIENIRLAFVKNSALVPYRQVAVGSWVPSTSNCHANVEKWVELNPKDSVVRGWVLYAENQLTAHSVVRDDTGKLFDITPLGNEALRMTMLFVQHPDDEASFQILKAKDPILRFGG